MRAEYSGMFCRCCWLLLLLLAAAAAAAAVLNAEGSTCDCTQPIEIKRQTRRYPPWSGTHTHTTVFDDERQENTAIHAAAIMPLYTCSGIRAAMHEAATVPL